jgi:hypothetical protein
VLKIRYGRFLQYHCGAYGTNLKVPFIFIKKMFVPHLQSKPTATNPQLRTSTESGMTKTLHHPLYFIALELLLSIGFFKEIHLRILISGDCGVSRLPVRGAYLAVV